VMLDMCCYAAGIDLHTWQSRNHLMGMLQRACSRHLVSFKVRYVFGSPKYKEVRKESISLIAGTIHLCDGSINTTSI
jgi:hypothetical protein